MDTSNMTSIELVAALDAINLVYVRNLQRFADEHLYVDPPGTGFGQRPIEELQKGRIVMFLDREAGGLDTELDDAYYDEFFRSRPRADGLDWRLYRESGDPAIAIVADNGDLRFLPADDSDWAEREEGFRIHADELAQKLTIANQTDYARFDEFFQITPSDAYPEYDGMLASEWGQRIFNELPSLDVTDLVV